VADAQAVPRRDFLPFARPDVGAAEIDAVVEVMRSGWLTTGPRTMEFESAFAEYVGATHAVACNSGTSALHLALDALRIGPGDEVIVPTYTFTATAEVVQYLGARPVLVDVNPTDLNIDVEAAEAAITASTKAIIGVDVGGIPCDWPALRRVADRRKIALVDDAAHALPGQLAGLSVGLWADLTAFSFYATKTLTTGEGGMLVTHGSDWAARARVMRLHGIAQDAWDRYSEKGSWYYDVVAPGFKYNMTDIAAAMGLVQLGRLEATTERRHEIAGRYRRGLGGHPALALPDIPDGAVVSWHLFLLRLELEHLSIDRAEFIRQLKDRSIGTSVHFIPLHRHPYYRDALGYRSEMFPVAEYEFHRVISLPIYSLMTDTDAEDVVSAVLEVAATAAKRG
jgi:dTDP-4-amino-4,6-dideoxygalactose transaminase